MKIFYCGKVFLLKLRTERKKKENGFSEIIDKNKKRLLSLGIILTMILFMLVTRLAYIQIIKKEDYYLKATNQWFKEIPVGVARGRIYDRNMQLLTNKNILNYVVIFPDIFQKTDSNLDIISKLTGIDKQMLRYERLRGNRPIQLQTIEISHDLMKEAMGIRGVYPLEIEERYDEKKLASHLIGYINKIDNIGFQGLERYYNELLIENQSFKIGAIVDAQKRIIPGLGYKYIQESTSKERKNIVTTIDINIQKIIEEEFDSQKRKGSIVVLNAKNGDLLGMVSRPNFNQNDVASHLNSSEQEFFNRAIQIAYPPGSVFKIVLAAAALENNLIAPEQTYFCKGYESFEENVIKCSSYEKGGHGWLDLKSAFAVSCNSYFIQLGKEIGGKEILSMAERLGFGKKTGIELPEEIPGTLPDEDYIKGAGIGNTSIGQGVLGVTPLQIAKMTAIIANDGIDTGTHLTKEIVDDDGMIVEDFSSRQEIQRISKNTAKELQKMMEKVVVEGTARSANSIDRVSFAGKTGSAEAVSDGKNTVHAWFTGYFPVVDPKYVITIIVEDGESGSRVAVPLFSNIAERINNLSS